LIFLALENAGFAAKVGALDPADVPLSLIRAGVKRAPNLASSLYQSTRLSR
jgi:hypothetical protein